MSLNPKTKSYKKLVKRLAREITWQHDVRSSGRLTLSGIDAAVAKIKPNAPRSLIEESLKFIIDGEQQLAGYCLEDAARHRNAEESYQALLFDFKRPVLKIVGGAGHDTP